MQETAILIDFTKWKTIARTLFPLCIIAANQALLAAEPVLDHVEVRPGEVSSEIVVHFFQPMIYQSHRPQKRGDYLQILLRPATIDQALQDELTQLTSSEESLAWKPTPNLPLSEVAFDPAGSAGPTLKLRFGRQIRFEVFALPNAQGVRVVVPHDVIPKRSQQPSDTLPQPLTYAVNLRSSPNPLELVEIEELQPEPGLLLYATTFRSMDGSTWHRLRLGPFSRKRDAAIAAKTLGRQFPGAWVATVNAPELVDARSNGTRFVAPASAPLAGDSETPATATAPRGFSQQAASRAAKLMATAREAMIDQDFDTAVRLYGKVLRLPNLAEQPLALEHLGVARIRKGQLAQAKAAFEQYLLEYPTSEGAERVQQRLDALLTAQASTGNRVSSDRGRRGKSAGRDGAGKSNWKILGSFSQFGRKDAIFLEKEDEERTQVSYISSDLNVLARYAGERWDAKAQIVTGYSYDLLEDGPGSDARISSFYVDVVDKQKKGFFRVGRQSRTFTGVFGRFDGLMAGYHITDKAEIKAVAGFPVTSSKDTFLDSDRPVMGLGVVFDQLIPDTRLTAYTVAQNNAGLANRRAIGVEARYTGKQGSWFGQMDYDYLFDEINSFVSVGNWRFPSGTSMNFSYDYRRSPFLTTGNAILGQQVETLEELQDLTSLSDEKLQAIALGRTALLKYATVGISHPLTKKLQIGADASLSNLSNTHALDPIPGSPNALGIEAVEGTGNEYNYALQLIGNSWVMDGDSSIWSWRHFAGSRNDRDTITASWRFPITRKIRVRPRLRIDRREDIDDGDIETTIRPSLKINYRLSRKMRLEFETGYEWETIEDAMGKTRNRGYFFNIGYRKTF